MNDPTDYSLARVVHVFTETKKPIDSELVFALATMLDIEMNLKDEVINRILDIVDNDELLESKLNDSDGGTFV